MQFPSFKNHMKIQVMVSRCNSKFQDSRQDPVQSFKMQFQVSRVIPRSSSEFQVAVSKFQDSHQDLGQGLKLQFPSFKIHTKIQVRVSSCTFRFSTSKPRSMSEFEDAVPSFCWSYRVTPQCAHSEKKNSA